ncbi:type II toxin-antitoxin system HipA family toxin [Solimicrobium silvestre]|uniref:HipA N-terminal domain n=1 Tax=Solimicrobium silvestre TaxID=2099400 RepID=A0A2S9H358_9BURK|nr:type II toxin-antitoxin system HipA family toxin [Solimicrobium silvestre]PRC94400.1 HipA N-terminal domain [Solimicrobium silvestre]
MGRHSHTQRLIVWLNGLPVGEWDAAPGRNAFGYFDEWIQDDQGRPLSLSLPFTPSNERYRGELVANYFDNLLPDRDLIRKRLAQRFKTGGVEPYQLLSEIGRDCVGAIQLLPPDEEPQNLYQIVGRPLDEPAIAKILRNATSTEPLRFDDDDHDLRLSIAGAQEKSALLFHQNQWLYPGGSTPTTHILKLPLGIVGNMQADMRTSVENEWLCSKIVAAFGLPVAHCDISTFEDQKVLVVERFDRKYSADGKWIVRLPQEDFCQVTGTAPLHKYQADGGPGIINIMDVLLGSDQKIIDRRNFFKTQLIFWLLAAIDGHAKNFSIAHLPGSQYRATPLYDVLSAHPVIGTGQNQYAPQKVKLAMAIRGSKNYYEIAQIQRRHWTKMAQQVGLGNHVAEEIIVEVLAAVNGVVDAMYNLLPVDFPIDVAQSILDGILHQSDKLSAMPPFDQR